MWCYGSSIAEPEAGKIYLWYRNLGADAMWKAKFIRYFQPRHKYAILIESIPKTSAQHACFELWDESRLRTGTQTNCITVSTALLALDPKTCQAKTSPRKPSWLPARGTLVSNDCTKKGKGSETWFDSTKVLDPRLNHSRDGKMQKGEKVKRGTHSIDNPIFNKVWKARKMRAATSTDAKRIFIILSTSITGQKLKLITNFHMNYLKNNTGRVINVKSTRGSLGVSSTWVAHIYPATRLSNHRT